MKKVLGVFAILALVVMVVSYSLWQCIEGCWHRPQAGDLL